MTPREQFVLNRWRRYRFSLLLEATLWVAVLVWMFVLIRTGASVWKEDHVFPWREVIEFVLLGLLVWWPIFRARIIYGYWMRDWQDTPDSHFRTDQQSPNQHQRPQASLPRHPPAPK